MLAWFGWYLFKSLVMMGRFRGTEWFFVPVGCFCGLLVTYLQSFLEWVLRQQLNLICLMFIFAILSYLNGKKPETIRRGRQRALQDDAPPGQADASAT